MPASPERADGVAPGPLAHPPLVADRRLAKYWTYLGAWSEELSVCAARVRVGLATQEFWAVWDREAGVLRERTRRRPGRVRIGMDRLQVEDGDVRLDLALVTPAGSCVEVTTPYGAAAACTRKTAVTAVGTVSAGGRTRQVQLPGLLDQSAGHHPRRTTWQWSAGAGVDTAGRSVTWNLVSGLHDRPPRTEDTVWIDGVPTATGPAHFSSDLTRAGAGGLELIATHEAERSRSENLLVVRSSYRQPFASFSGTLPGGAALNGFGVMEHHDALW